MSNESTEHTPGPCRIIREGEANWIECKACGLLTPKRCILESLCPDCRKGLATLQAEIDGMAEGQYLMIVGTVIDHMMTGTRKVGIERDGTIKVMYTDGIIESRAADQSILQTHPRMPGMVIKLVGFVQANRATGQD